MKIIHQHLIHTLCSLIIGCYCDSLLSYLHTCMGIHICAHKNIASIHTHTLLPPKQKWEVKVRCWCGTCNFSCYFLGAEQLLTGHPCFLRNVHSSSKDPGK